jgi:PBP1b-binding outer membrane lipoprotein LpoB
MKNLNPLSSTITLRNIVIIAVSALFISGCAGNPPTEQMAVSKVAVTNATSAGSNEFAPLPLRSAMQKMDAAELAMTAEDYVLARQLAEQAQVDAQLAAATARSVKAQKAASALQEDNRVLRQEIDRKAQ